MNHKESEDIDFYLINTSSEGSRFFACISSRITSYTSGRNQYQINDNGFNELNSQFQLYKLLRYLDANVLIWSCNQDYLQDQPDNYLKRRSNKQCKKENQKSLFSHLFHARRYLLVWKQLKVSEKLLFQVSLPEIALFKKAFTLLTSALRHHTIALFGFPLTRFHQTDTPVFQRNGTFDIYGFEREVGTKNHSLRPAITRHSPSLNSLK
ncbi:CPS_HP_G0023010.mRNA.1.CDS.1 [Saccharomyces cerevisiae]|nr:CPS_HP_G0023010.mRNA.1.CDS.1 [Saccharomyces cerevisiae]CAI6462778.1 CPS_HP_G0023010.mRNA.1.CDS.1 [Saccharomyces cerevisiae]